MLFTSYAAGKCKNGQIFQLKTNRMKQVHVEEPTNSENIRNHPKYKRWQHNAWLFLEVMKMFRMNQN